MPRPLERSYEVDDALEAAALLERLRALRSRLIARAGCDLADSLFDNVGDAGYRVELRTPSASRLVTYDKEFDRFRAEQAETTSDA